MPGHARVSGGVDEQCHNFCDGADSADHWLSDPTQLINWQGQLVTNCQAISDQLIQINQELKLDSEVSLRVVGHPASGPGHTGFSYS